MQAYACRIAESLQQSGNNCRFAAGIFYFSHGFSI